MKEYIMSDMEVLRASIWMNTHICTPKGIVGFRKTQVPEYWYAFSEATNGLGRSCMVICHTCKANKDITDVSVW